MNSLDEYRIRQGFDIFIVPGFAQNILKCDPRQIQHELETSYPVRGAGDSIQSGQVQWVDGDNAALKYRGNVLKRGKIWLQRSDTRTGWLRYGYTGWQWNVLQATASLSKCKEMEPVADNYDMWASSIGFPAANHYIVTKYRDGQHNIGMHSDKVADIHPDSLITVVKTGKCGRLFQISEQDGIPFFSQELQPGTAVIMTVEANLKTKHGVPVVEHAESSGSIVFRTIKTILKPEKVFKEVSKRRRTEESDDDDDDVPLSVLAKRMRGEGRA